MQAIESVTAKQGAAVIEIGQERQGDAPLLPDVFLARF
jgi:hypothetical protein